MQILIIMVVMIMIVMVGTMTVNVINTPKSLYIQCSEHTAPLEL